MSSKYLDLTGLAHYDQKIKQYIGSHSGGSQLYRHRIHFIDEDGDYDFYGELITNTSSQFTLVTLKNYLLTNGTYYPFFIFDTSNDSIGVYYGYSNNVILILHNGSYIYLSIGNVFNDTVTAL